AVEEVALLAGGTAEDPVPVRLVDAVLELDRGGQARGGDGAVRADGFRLLDGEGVAGGGAPVHARVRGLGAQGAVAPVGAAGAGGDASGVVAHTAAPKIAAYWSANCCRIGRSSRWSGRTHQAVPQPGSTSPTALRPCSRSNAARRAE